MFLKHARLLPEKFPTTEHYPFNLTIFQKTECIQFDTPVTFFVGENGSGKSTLLEALCTKCGIYIWGQETGTRYVKNPYERYFHRALDIEWQDGPVPGSFFAAQTFRNFSALLDEWSTDDPQMLKYFGGKSLMSQSHGQSLMSYFKSRYKIRGLYFLDEPETALSPKSQLDLLDVLTEMSRNGHAQFIIATHSPIIMAVSGAAVKNFDSIPVTDIAFEDTEHYKVYKMFMDGK
jgi:predicted ATPase